MAGSFGHCVELVDGKLCLREEPLLDHLGDAGEAIEEYHFMVMHLAGQDPRKIYEAHVAYVHSHNPEHEMEPYAEWLEGFKPYEDEEQ